MDRHAIDVEDDKDPDGRWRQFRTRFSAAHAAEGIFESPLLRLDGVQLTHDVFEAEGFRLKTGGSNSFSVCRLQPQVSSLLCGELHFLAITDSSGRVLVSRALPQSALADQATNYLNSG